MNNYLFLDIDGVLISGRSITEYKSAKILDPASTHVLSQIIREFNFNVILTSTWRLLDYKLEDLVTQLGFYNIKIYDSISKSTIIPRYDLILDYLKTIPLDKLNKILILDDEPNHIINNCPELKPYCYKVEFEQGLLSKDIVPIRELIYSQ